MRQTKQQRKFSPRMLLLRVLAFGLAAFCLGFFGRFAQAQLTNGDVIGTVTDTTGAVIPGARVTLTNTGTNIAASATTNGTGDYTFNLLNPGRYTVTIEAKGFKKLVIPGFALAAGDRLRENEKMEPGNVEETVEVSAAAPLLQTDSSTVQSTITDRSVQDLPLNGRNFINLVQVQAGVNQGQAGSIGSGQRPDDRAATSTVVANGQSDYFNNEMIDGMDNNEREQGFIGVAPSIDAIAEVQVLTNDFTADVGRSAGAVVNIITKSGTETFHGSAFEYFRNDIFNANPYNFGAQLPKTEYRQNQFGGSIGGPIRRNKTFFFADVQDNRVIQGLSSGLLTVPSVQENPGCAGNTTGNYDFTDNGGSVVNSASTDPVGKAYFSMFPCPNVSTTATSDNYENVVRQPQMTFTADGRIDQHFSNGDTLFGRYSYNNVNTNVPGWFPAVKVAGLNVQPSGNQYGFPGDSTTNVHGVAFVYSHLFTPNLVMQLKTGYTRIGILSRNINYGENVSSAIGLENANTPAAPGTTGLAPTYFLTGGYANLGDSIYTPINDTNNTFQYEGSLIYTHGAHNIKAGAQIIRRQLNYFQSPYPLGWIYYAGLTGNAAEDMLVGDPLGYLRSNLLIQPGYRGWEEGYYAEDDWRFNSKLTLNLGLRYDIFTPITEAHNRYANFDYSTLTLIQGTADPHIGIKTNYKNFAPRVGFSASVRPGTVVRGGYGISYYPMDIGTALPATNPPNSYATNCLPCFGWWPNLPLPTPSSTTNLSGSLTDLSPNYNTASVQQFNLMVQQEAGANVFTLGGIGELGRHIEYDTTINLPYPNGPYANDATTGPPAPPALLTATSLPNVSTISYYEGEASQNYYALQAIFARRLTKGLEFNVNYTWAHDLTDSSAVGSGSNTTGLGLIPTNPHYDYGNAGVDIRQRFATTWTYALAFGNKTSGAMALLAKGWTTNLILFWQTGEAFTVVDDFTNASGSAQINLPETTSDRPSMVAGQSYRPAHASLTNWLNLNAFTPQPAGTPGNEAPNQFFGPHTRRADLSIFKNFELPEKMTLQFRAEVYNISNTANFEPPNATISGWMEGPEHGYSYPIKAGDNPNFCGATTPGCTSVGLLPGDTPTSAGGFGTVTTVMPNLNPRQFQFALKLLF